MKYHDVVGYVVNSDVYCADCAPLDDDNPIFAGSEWAWPGPCCEACDEPLDVSIIGKPARPPMDKFMIAYVDCALWSSLSEHGTPLDKSYDYRSLDAQSLWDMYQDCQDFKKAAGHLLDDMDPEQAGHDFWLTRNRHGTGFWDRGLGELGRKLTDLAHKWGPADIFETGDEDRPISHN